MLSRALGWQIAPERDAKWVIDHPEDILHHIEVRDTTVQYSSGTYISLSRVPAPICGVGFVAECSSCRHWLDRNKGHRYSEQRLIEIVLPALASLWTNQDKDAQGKEGSLNDSA